ncbi:pyridoxamine 5'-phosphate oxidase family protein [Allorhodopirellula heiligendammensis]|uniref:Pyridoxamine 5'-phosphate oxidase n=1 Tax=Allorhodopirellula heiligendammensis TaxID=2714739 RepID=A0A5C6BU48_9BACT|nr:pyridoxamine 5'-phosphate oxidase family protein [Allorhodopirellula heiligendammensis]TWU15558.1 Pyridoxamine 5'-phosphate oxidase [Allorhodopirellula heiligendammensis]
MNTEQKLIDLINDFDTAMLVTRGEREDLEARPMAIAKIEDDGQIWFVTDRHSGKVSELKADANVVLAMQSSNKFVSLTGVAAIIDDRAQLDELWNEAWKVWFPDGKSSESITLVRVRPTHGQYWDNSGLSGIKYLIKAGNAYLHGDRPEVDEKINASITM